VSYGFPIIHFCNPGVHYETPCIVYELTWLQDCVLKVSSVDVGSLDVNSELNGEMTSLLFLAFSLKLKVE
jgi:hypothetical protein